MSNTSQKPDKKAFYEEFAEKVIEMLEQGAAPWQKPWTANQDLAPHNPVSGTVYRGGNRLWLSMMCQEDPRWMTFNQASEAGYKIRKGSKSVPIEFATFEKRVDVLDENGNPVLDENGKPKKEIIKLDKPIYQQFRVFNGSQIEGLPPLEPGKPLYEWEPLEKAESILEKSGAKISHDQADMAFYSSSTDEIHLPPKSNFDAPDKYYATALHELGHWAGHESRLNRDMSGPFGSEKYAREELRAEIGSWMLGQDIGIGHDPGQHAAYVESWIKALKEDPLEIMRACRDAEQIKDYVLGLDLDIQREKGMEKTNEISPEENKHEPVIERESRPAPGKTWLYVPREEKDKAKALGARWDWRANSWYAPQGTDLVPLKQWLTPPEKTAEAALEGPAQQAAVAKAPVQEAAAATEKTWLYVPRKEKDQAKAVGARWDKEAQLWYAPQGTDMSRLERWSRPPERVNLQTTLDPRQEFAEKLAELGLDLKGELPEIDGEIHRVPLLDKHSKAGAYCLYSNDGRPAGWAQNFVSGEKVNLVATGVRLSPEEMEYQRQAQAIRRLEAEKKREQVYDLAAQRCRAFFAKRSPASSVNAYLQAKGVEAFGLKESPSGKELLVPLQNKDGEIRSIQYIAEDGSKRFESGGQKKGCFHVIGSASENSPNVLICEGYATGASLHQATGLPVAVAFDAGNLKPVAEALKEKFPNSTLTLCADNDHSNKLNVGLEKAKDAALAVNGKVVFPRFTSEEMSRGLTDFNDLHQARGLKKVQEQVFEQSLGKTKANGVEL